MLLSIDADGHHYDLECYDNSLSPLISAVILKGQTYPRIEFVDDVGLVLDVGANIGASALYFATQYPQAEVYAFEPASEPWDLLERNTRGCPNVHLMPFGLLDVDTEATLFSGLDDPMTASLHPSAETTARTQTSTFRAASRWIEESGLGPPDLLKVDTEGCELAILADLAAMLPEVRVIYLEYHSEEDRRLIDDLLAPTHVIVAGTILQVHRGEFTYVARSAFPSPESLEASAIRPRR